MTVALAKVDPDLFDGRTQTNGNALSNTDKRSRTNAVDSSKIKLTDANHETQKEIAKTSELTVDTTQIAATNVASSASQDVKQVESSVAGRPIELPSASAPRKFESFSVGAGVLSSLPEKSSKQLTAEQGSYDKDRAPPSSKAATKGGQQSTDLKSINRDRGTDLPTHL